MNQPDTKFASADLTERSNKWNWALLALLVYGILLAVTVIGSGFKLATGEHAKSLFEFAANPILGLIIGMVSTALIQSSSTVSSIVVAMVAGGLPIEIAVPMIMGANIGTSITSTIVSLGHVADKEEFQRAFNAATIHDFFNVICVFIFLPLEIAFGFLEKLSGAMVELFSSSSGMVIGGFNPIKVITQPFSTVLTDWLSFMSPVYAGVTMAIIGVALIIISITFMGKTMKSLMVGKAKDILHSSIGKGPLRGIASGTVVTVLVQSSSTTTSLVVPLVGNGVLTARDIYPFTLGANIGTCITALLAAIAVTGPNAGFALQIAFVHLMYNVLGVVVIYGVKFLRNIPLNLSYQLSVNVAEQKLYGLAYILTLFFILPLSIITVAG
ncbi:Na/Pi symporter [Paraneptunicella aestuarii]|uniref:Na/Pi symporter n=1 Tax=Paraneptunicella aestuarii TaxID=2831148 RepID=UPI001E5014A0|nr:Na/Pi symporter [Paraneptunicella aestuarii]UAA38295.1 Na/Pi symporter [Paraneptunicella aestuarii]